MKKKNDKSIKQNQINIIKYIVAIITIFYYAVNRQNQIGNVLDIDHIYLNDFSFYSNENLKKGSCMIWNNTIERHKSRSLANFYSKIERQTSNQGFNCTI